MARKFPMFLDISNKEIRVYGAGRIATRRVETLLAFAPLLTVCAPNASEEILSFAGKGELRLFTKRYEEGSIPEDTFMVLAATDDAHVNRRIWQECREKGILVNVCSDRKLCDFQFPGVVIKEELVIGVNAGGNDHRGAKAWTDRIRKEVEKDGYDNQAEKASDDGSFEKDGT